MALEIRQIFIIASTNRPHQRLNDEHHKPQYMLVNQERTPVNTICRGDIPRSSPPHASHTKHNHAAVYCCCLPLAAQVICCSCSHGPILSRHIVTHRLPYFGLTSQGTSLSSPNHAWERSHENTTMYPNQPLVTATSYALVHGSLVSTTAAIATAYSTFGTTARPARNR